MRIISMFDLLGRDLFGSFEKKQLIGYAHISKFLLHSPVVIMEHGLRSMIVLERDDIIERYFWRIYGS